MQAPSHPASGPSLFFCGLSAVLLYGISGGIRSDIGILLEPLREATGLSYGGLSFAIAVLQLSFGLSQPFWGLLAARRSHRFVLLSGVGLFLLGLLGLSLFRSLWGLVLTLGLCLGCGAGAISFGLLLETVIFAVGPQKGALISGFINAAAGLGSTFFSPLLSRLSLVGGIPTVSVVLSLIMIGTLPFLFYLTQPLKRMVLQEKGPVPEASFGLLLQGALKRPEFRYLLGAFTTCGFHMALIEAHLFSQLLSYGLQRPRAAHAFAAYGLSTVIGALISGYLSGHVSKNRLLTGLGSTFFSPLLSRLSLVGGIPTVSVVLSLIMIGTLPFLFYLTQPLKRMVLQEKGPVPEASFGLLLQGALKRPEFRYLLGAFTTCGFHMALIEAHLFSQLLSYGLQRPRAAHAFAAYGLSTVIGALISGYLSGHVSKNRLLTIYYGFRAGLTAIYLFFLPKTFLSALFFCIGLGMSGGATVTPTSGIVTERFPLAQSAALVGLLFLGHQLGAFLSAFLGGMTVAATGSYQGIWGIDIVFCLLASYLSAKILPHQQGK